jgi:capsular polysaccharide biosynthesis protein
VLITRGGDVRIANRYAECLPAARIHQISLLKPKRRVAGRARPRVVVKVCPGEQAIAAYLTGVAAPQVIVDLAPDRRQRARFAALLYFLDDQADRHSAYIVRDPDAGSPRRRLAATVARLKAGTAGPLTESAAWDSQLAEAVAGVRQQGRLVTITVRGRHALKLQDRDATMALQARQGDTWGEQIATRPTVRFTARSSIWTNVPAARFDPVFRVPPLFVREYRDVVCAPRGLAVAGGAVLPVSFHKRSRTLLTRSEYAPNVSRWSVALDPALDDASTLAGAYYHLDSPFPWGFGHFMGEDMSKLWAWDQAKARHPDLKVLLSSASRPEDPPPTGQPKDHQVALLAAFGISADDIVCIDGPARVELLVGASRMWDNPRFVHPDITRIWDARREALRSPVAERPPTSKKVFVSRGHDLRRHCRNAVELEQLFASHGYEIVRPETMSIQAQVDAFADAEAVAGFGGSGMFNMMHTYGPARWIVIAPTTYTARNEYLIASARGGDYHHFLCEPIQPDAGEDPAWPRFHWDYEFDFARDGAALNALLDG